ncbi:4-alpha-glucanotransferase [Arthrobacter monumenti]
MGDATGQDLTDDGNGRLLRQLAEANGISTTFKGWDGTGQNVDAQTLRKVLAALGVTAETDEDVQTALNESELAPWRQLLPPVVVAQQGQPHQVAVHKPTDNTAQLWIIGEDGTRYDISWADVPAERRTVDGVGIERRMASLPAGLPLGWHTLHAESGSEQAQCTLVIAPQQLTTTARLAGERGWGLMAQLYSVRSKRSWGIGDLADLADLAAISGAGPGAGFVLVNPLHAAEPAPPVEPSPYLPTSRRFFNPLYIRVEDIPEHGYLRGGPRKRIEDLAERLREANQAADMLDRDSTYAAKLEALEFIYQVERAAARQQQFDAFCAGQGQGLEDFALWCAMTEEAGAGATRADSAARPDGAYAQEQRVRLAGRIDFHKWLQWICDQQLETVQSAAKKAGMGIGVMHDLAVGVQSRGADAWVLQDVLAPGVSVGAPPDMFNQQGQDWAQPPWHPARLAASGYAAYRDMLRTILRHAGGIRIDHILGLFRLWWIPEGAAPGEGAYVHYDHEALIGILALEAQRAGAVVVGEDLGTFEPWVQDYLAERGILGTSILWFEQTGEGPLSPEEYRKACLTSVNTHDLPPTAGYLAGEHVDLRDSLGLLNRPAAEERADDAATQEAVLALARERGLLPKSTQLPTVGTGVGTGTNTGTDSTGTNTGTDSTDGDTGTDGVKAGDEVQRTVEALYALIAQTPSVLIGVALVDAVGERRTQNQPGTSDEYPNWRIPLAGPDSKVVLIDDLPHNQRFLSLVKVLQTDR